jgi:hypothetical protein
VDSLGFRAPAPGRFYQARAGKDKTEIVLYTSSNFTRVEIHFFPKKDDH